MAKKLSEEKMQLLADERARILYEKYEEKKKRAEMAQFKAFGVPYEQRREFTQLVIESLEKLEKLMKD